MFLLVYVFFIEWKLPPPACPGTTGNIPGISKDLVAHVGFRWAKRIPLITGIRNLGTPGTSSSIWSLNKFGHRIWFPHLPLTRRYGYNHCVRTGAN